MPTKARREKEAKLKAAREASAKESAWIKDRPEGLDDLGSNLTDQQPPEPHWKLRGGLRVADENGNWASHPSIGQSGGARSASKNKRIEELKKRYPKLWGVKGKAAHIASLEQKAGRPINGRTIQKYFKIKK